MECAGTNPEGSGEAETDEVVQRVADCVAPSRGAVVDWHHVDQILTRDWDRPLVRLLRFFVTPPSPTQAEMRLSDDKPRRVADDVVIDLITAEILDLTGSLHLGEELAS